MLGSQGTQYRFQLLAQRNNVGNISWKEMLHSLSVWLENDLFLGQFFLSQESTTSD